MGIKKSPAYNVIMVPVEKVQADNYSPNIAAPPGMKLLEPSIWEDGFTMPCVCHYDKEKDIYILVDGFHRYSALETSKRIFQRESGMLPVAVIDKDLSDRMSPTIRHNRARGTHNIESMCYIVAELDKASMSDQWIMKNIGMDRDELLHLKQISDLVDLFANRNFSILEEDQSGNVDKKPACQVSLSGIDFTSIYPIVGGHALRRIYARFFASSLCPDRNILLFYLRRAKLRRTFPSLFCIQQLHLIKASLLEFLLFFLLL